MSRDISKLPLYQSDASYNQSLLDLKQRARDRLPLTGEDSDAVGDKYTECNLGLCDEKIEESQDGVYRRPNHHCPHDARYFDVHGTRLPEREPDLNGCFYTCRVFSPTRGRPLGDVYARIAAVQLIAEVQETSAEEGDEDGV
jgi:hypothetical protein